MGVHNINQTLHAYHQTLASRNVIVARGEERRSWDDAALVFDSERGVLPNIVDRKLNVRYALEEFLWYCRADRFDASILQHATMWKKLQQADGGFNSNYGQYIFGANDRGSTQFDFCLQTLIQDPGSSRASMTLLHPRHLYHENTDVVCTYAIAFQIRGDRLNMSVRMRSNDVVFGLTNDAFCFSMIHRLMTQALRIKYPDLKVGMYNHNAVTLHVYERHYEMLRRALADNAASYVEINPPMFTMGDVNHLVWKTIDVPNTEFMRWAQSVQS